MIEFTKDELYTLKMILKEHIFETTDLVEEADDFDKHALQKELDLFKSMYEKVIQEQEK
ncbi:MAG: hypothetical protein ACI35S_09075 [Anaeroplasma sp.]